MARRPNGETRNVLSRLRQIGAGAILAVLVLYVLADAFSLPGLRDDFHADGTIVATLGGFFLALVIPELASRIPSIKPRPSDEDAKE